MKFNEFFNLALIFLLKITYIKADEPALKINLNPPEENTKDTQSKLWIQNIVIRRIKRFNEIRR